MLFYANYLIVIEFCRDSIKKWIIQNLDFLHVRKCHLLYQFSNTIPCFFKYCDMRKRIAKEAIKRTVLTKKRNNPLSPHPLLLNSSTIDDNAFLL